MPGFRSLLREPLIHFLVIGAVVFGAHSVWASRQNTAERTISISAQQIQRLTAIWAGEAGREPTADDVKGLVAEHVREEVLYREALRLGLDRDDTIIRRRLAQKMGFVVNRDGGGAAPNEAELRAAFEADPQAYARAPRLSFVHVPFNFTQEQEADETAMLAALEALSAAGSQADPTKLGHPFLLSRVQSDLSEIELARLFGRDFARDVFALEAAGWSGPHRSRLAWHLVRIENRNEGGVPVFEDIIDTVRTRETARQTQEANAAEMSKLLERYKVVLNGDAN